MEDVARLRHELDEKEKELKELNDAGAVQGVPVAFLNRCTRRRARTSP